MASQSPTSRRLLVGDYEGPFRLSSVSQVPGDIIGRIDHLAVDNPLPEPACAQSAGDGGDRERRSSALHPLHYIIPRASTQIGESYRRKEIMNLHRYS